MHQETALPKLCLQNSCNKFDGHRGECNPYPMESLGNLPKDIVKKIGKTSMTRGAQPYDRVPYQNRVRRWNRAIVPYAFKDVRPDGGFENEFVIMVRPEEYFNPDTRQRKQDFPNSVVVGENAFVYYDNRENWNRYPPANYNWEPCRITLDGKSVKRRITGIVDEGHFLARVPATTTPGSEGKKIVEGLPQGIRFFEYASQDETWQTMMQLAYLAWSSRNVEKYTTGKMPILLKSILKHHSLDDDERFRQNGALSNNVTCCPLCKESIDASELIEKVEQVPGREVVDLTITKANLFHLDALRPGEFNHKVYRVAWGHYHCNVVARDMGIDETLNWMERVLINAGRISP